MPFTIGDGKAAKIVFVHDRCKKDWLAILCTDAELADAELVLTYGKRSDIEVLFKMAKQQQLFLRRSLPRH